MGAQYNSAVMVHGVSEALNWVPMTARDASFSDPADHCCFSSLTFMLLKRLINILIK